MGKLDVGGLSQLGPGGEQRVLTLDPNDPAAHRSRSKHRSSNRVWNKSIGRVSVDAAEHHRKRGRTIMRRKNIEDNFKKCLDRAANARSRAEEAVHPARKAEYLRLESNWIRLARSYEFAKRLKSSWYKRVSANIIDLHHRILEAYYSPEFDEERSDHRTVSLARHGAYEVRFVGLSRRMQTGAEQLWLELFDHDHERTIDSYGGRTFVDITAAAESLCLNAKYLSHTD
jgi:hypothetical protein